MSTRYTASSRWRPRTARSRTRTYIFTLAQLHAAGLSKPLIQEKLLEFEQQLKDECQRELQELDDDEPVQAVEQRGTDID